MVNRKFGMSGIWLLVIPLIFMGAFYFFPLGKLVSLSFSQASSTINKAVNWQIIGGAAGFTFFQAGFSTILTVLLGLPAAYLFGRFNFTGKNALRIASTLPFILPTVVVAAGFNTLIGPKGWLNLALMGILGSSEPLINIQNSLTAILLAHVFYNTSIVIRVVGSALAQLDRKLEDAAQTLGASPWKTFMKITVPLLLPSILSAVLLVFLFDFTSFGVILMMGGPRFTTLEVEIYIQTMQFLNLPLAGLLSLIQLGFTMVVTFLLMKMGDGGIGVPVMPRLQQEGLRNPVKGWEKAFTFVVVLLLLLLLTSPIVSLVIRSFSVKAPAINGGTGEKMHWSLSYYRELFINRQRSLFYVPPIKAVWNSLKFAGTSAFISLSLGMMLAYGLLSGKNLRAVNLLMMLPLGTSAVTLGLGFFTAFSGGAGSLGWVGLLIPLAHALISLPFVLRVVQPALQSIPANLKLAAQSLGAKPLDVWRFVELPIIWRALMTAAVYAFTISLGEFGATSFLSRPDMPTMPIAIFRYLNLPGSSNYGQAMAMAVIILFVCIVSMAFLDRLQFNFHTGT
ncbi:MAG: iron ABC transporter permease [Pelolinea sp.]|nr:iron ABC transporter permease [Pelolinea sp.]